MMEGVQRQIKSFDSIRLHKRCVKKHLNRFYLKGECSHLYLTLREVSCVLGLLRHYTNAEIASTLSISPRVVEANMVMLKAKFMCYNKSQLYEKLNLLCMRGILDQASLTNFLKSPENYIPLE